ncbi:hypothetical protein OKW45_007976 [Paraburkholderia sp. WSM4175]|uniref:hypothetical protein n=1 Tax=Paraburkholderia sp. WSM4175 TaxID=2991072 RepID=UPI003D1B2C68
MSSNFSIASTSARPSPEPLDTAPRESSVAPAQQPRTPPTAPSGRGIFDNLNASPKPARRASASQADGAAPRTPVSRLSMPDLAATRSGSAPPLAQVSPSVAAESSSNDLSGTGRPAASTHSASTASTPPADDSVAPAPSHGPVTQQRLRERNAQQLSGLLREDADAHDEAIRDGIGRALSPDMLADLTVDEQRAAQAKYDLRNPENRYVTRGRDGIARYDTQKLRQIAADTGHPRGQRAHWILTALRLTAEPPQPNAPTLPRRAAKAIASAAGDAIDDIGAFVPARGDSGAFIKRLADKFGVHRKGMTPARLASKRPLKDAMNGISTGVHGHFNYDTAPLTDLVNLPAHGSTAIAAHTVQQRYANKLGQMLAVDVQQFRDAAAEAARRKTTPNPTPDPATPEARHDPSLPENQLLTERGGKWEYDRAKLGRIARDDAHPFTQHARDVLTVMSIAENQGKRRNGALYQATTSAIGLVGSGLLIGGSHGALLPMVVSGHATNALREALDLKKPFVEGRQNLRDEKAAEVDRRVKRDAGRFERDLQQIERDTGHQYSAAEVAGVYRHLYDNAERAVASQRSFGTRFAAGRHIDTGKGKAYREAEMNLVARHIRSIVGGGLGQADGDMLRALAAVPDELGLTRARREKRAIEAVATDPRIVASHTLLTDTGYADGDAALLLAKMAKAELATRDARDGVPATPNHRDAVAAMIGQPGLKKSDPNQAAEAGIKQQLGKRS